MTNPNDLEDLKVGDRVQTPEGIFGTVTQIKRKYVEILGDGVWYGDYLPHELRNLPPRKEGA